jgi:ethanolamine utilization microcompartment shell protein EutL
MHQKVIIKFQGENMSSTNFELRTLVFIDSLQPQLAQYTAKDNRVYDPAEYDAALFFEIAPAMEIHRMIDMALKATGARLGSVVTERQYGLMQIHHADQGEVKEAARAILKETGLTENDRAEVKILTNKIIRGVEQDHAIMFTGMAKGNMVLAGESVLIMEATPAAYLAIACNEALKAANVKLIDIKPYGASGRLILSGPESEIDSAAEAATAILDKLNESKKNNIGSQLG